ncbi:MAG: AAA family ATPase [Cyanosarcina radialis HA8281-LM2]|jgi:capsular exopolysaccharide synthesis family protein|nr:AAA family ATPase [Cyanosarcina radialis HA8281-LM2]
MEKERDSQLELATNSKQLTEESFIDRDDFSQPSRRGLNLWPLLRTVRRQALPIVGIATLTTLGALFLTLRTAKTYAGNFQLLIEPIAVEERTTEPSTLARTGTAGATPNLLALFTVDYPTQIKVLQSQDILNDIVKDVQQKYQTFNLNTLSKGLIVERLGGETKLDDTKIIQVSYEDLDPERAQFVLEKVQARYLNYSIDERKDRIDKAAEFIDQTTGDLQRNIASLQLEVQKMQQQYQLSDPKVLSEELFSQVRQLKAQQLQVQGLLEEQRGLYTSLQKQLALNPNEAIAAATFNQAPEYKNLIAQIKDTERQIAIQSARFTPDNPIIQSLEEQRQQLTDLLQQETQQLVGSNITPLQTSQLQKPQAELRQKLIDQLVSTGNQIQVLEIREQALADARNTYEQQALKFPDVARRYSNLQQQLDITTQTFTQLKTQRETLRVEAAQKQFPWKLIADASVPQDSDGNYLPADTSSPKKLIAGILGGLLLGLIVAIAIEKYRNIFYCSEDIQDATSVPVLGTIPPHEVKGAPNSPPTFTSFTDRTNNKATAQFLKAFNSLYSSTRFLFAAPIRSLAISSVEPGDGKTTVALQLAQSAAATDRRVLLVDANLSIPDVHLSLDLPNENGLNELLSQPLSPEQFIRRVPGTENLFVLTAGQPQLNSMRLLESSRLKKLMGELEKTFDLVIYDLPHLTDTIDTNFLAANTDGILMVVGLQKTSRSAVLEAIERLQAFRLPLLGIVANQVGRSRPSWDRLIPTTTDRTAALSESLAKD